MRAGLSAILLPFRVLCVDLGQYSVPIRLSFALAICMVLISHPTVAQSYTTDYDGLWDLSFGCGTWSYTGSQRKLILSFSSKIHIVNGEWRSEKHWAKYNTDDNAAVSDFYSDRIRLTVVADKVAIEFGIYTISNAAPSGVVKFEGRFTDARNASLSGFSQQGWGQKKMWECAWATLSSDSPAADSIAGREPIAEQQVATNQQATQSGAPAAPRFQLPANVELATPTAPAQPRELSEEQRFRALGRANMARIQQALVAFGSYDGPVDGVFGPATERAVKAWQKTQNTPETGYLATGQIEHLWQQFPAGSTPRQSAATSPPSLPPNPTGEKLAPSVRANTAAAGRLDVRAAELEARAAPSVGATVAEELFVGDPSDLLLFTNETPKAPHFARRIDGEASFRENQAIVCSVGEAASLDSPVSTYFELLFRKAHPSLQFDVGAGFSNQCRSAFDASGEDIVAVRRGEILSHESTRAGLVGALVNKSLRYFESLDFAAYQVALSLRDAEALRLDASVRNNTFDGYGLLDGGGATANVCALSSEDKEYVGRAAAEIRKGLTFDRKPSDPPQVSLAQADDVFLAAKAGRCGFIFGDASTLRTLLTALDRDGYHWHVVPYALPQSKAVLLEQAIAEERRTALAKMTNDQTEATQSVEAAQRTMVQQRAAALQQQTERAETLAQQRKLDEVRQKNEEASRRAELVRVRALVASRGRTVVDNFAQRLRQHMQSVIGEIADTRRRAALGEVLTEQEERAAQAKYGAERMEAQFPEWSALFKKAVQEEWDFGDINADLEDYGQAIWRSRVIEALAIKVQFPMMNRIIGERRTSCWVFIWINDEEFSFQRQARSSRCADFDGDFKIWATANGFKSQWKLAPQ